GDSWGQAFGSIAKGSKSFKQTMKQQVGQTLSQLAGDLVAAATEQILTQQAVTVATAAATAPTPAAIPAFVAQALGSFASALISVGWSGSGTEGGGGGGGGSSSLLGGGGGGGGGGGADPINFALGPVSYQLPGDISSFGPGNEPGQLGLRDILTGLEVQITDNESANLMSFIVGLTEQGLGSETNRLATILD
ncbi:unnamed protein product, partial [marine sediment metagenome]